MRQAHTLTILLIIVAFVSPDSLAQEEISKIRAVDSNGNTSYFDDLQTAIDEVREYSTIFLSPGDYYAEPSDFIDPHCGNCLDPETEVEASTGFVIKNRYINIEGSGPSTILHTNAGYGIYIEGCTLVQISKLAITDGVRDQDGNATDAAIVVRDSLVRIRDCEIYGNEGDYSETVAGIGGIMGREGADITVQFCKIHDNSWDGIALYRGARAYIWHNEIWNGRGAGIGITWDSYAFISGNNIHDYWKGIGSFGESEVDVFNNFVHDLRGWGIVATGTSEMECWNNTVVRCGNVGIAGWSEDAKIEIVNNIVAFNGSLDQWVAPRVGIWMNCDTENYVIENNCIYGNQDAEVAFHYEEFEDDTWGYWYERDLNGIGGNIYVDPILTGEGFIIDENSLCIDAGNAELLDADGSVSDIGATGGPYSER